MSEDDLREYLSFAEGLARQAGKVARHYAADVSEIVNKDDNSPVTQADEQINQLIIDKVAAEYSDIGVLGEERSSHGEPTSGLLWVCDPIDGTMPFTLGMQISTICLALVLNGRPIVGVVYDFAHDQMYVAAKGLGVWKNGTPLERFTSQPLPIVELEWWHSSPGDVTGLLKKLHAKRYQTPNFVSFSYACLQVAVGKTVGAVYAGDKPWDVAAVKVILDELSYRVTDLNGNEQRYDVPIRGAIVSSGELHKELFE